MEDSLSFVLYKTVATKSLSQRNLKLWTFLAWATWHSRAPGQPSEATPFITNTHLKVTNWGLSTWRPPKNKNTPIAKCTEFIKLGVRYSENRGKSKWIHFSFVKDCPFFWIFWVLDTEMCKSDIRVPLGKIFTIFEPRGTIIVCPAVDSVAWGFCAVTVGRFIYVLGVWQRLGSDKSTDFVVL